MTPGNQAGTVTIVIDDAGRHSEIEVTYQLTALTDTARRALDDFADGYPAYLQSWQDAITAWLHHRSDFPARRGRSRPGQTCPDPQRHSG